MAVAGTSAAKSYARRAPCGFVAFTVRVRISAKRRRGAALRCRLLGGGEGGGLGSGEDWGGFFGDAGAFEEARVLHAPQPDRVGEGEVAEIIGGDVTVLDQLVGLGQRVAHVDHVEMPDIRTED